MISQHDNIVSDGAISAPEIDEWLEILQEEHTPLEQFWPDEFQRYFDLFVKYLSKSPFHVRRSYGDGFFCQKGRKKNGEPYFRPCYPGLIAKMLDYDRWKRIQGLKEEKRYPPDFWIAMNTGRKSTVNAIDFDNKENVLGYYRETPLEDARPRPLVTMALEHLQAMKRVYDEFPNRIWCISSLTLGLHIWETCRFPKPIELIHAVTKPKLKAIGLGDTEVHPMFGRPHRRPFGKDYFTISESGIVEDWIEQLNYFENVGETPTFGAIYRDLRSKVKESWAHYRRDGGHGFKSFATPHLQKYFIGKNYVSTKHLEEDLKLCDQWAEQGFPSTIQTSIPVVIDLGTTTAQDSPPKKGSTTALKCEITLSKVCNGEWVQNCEKWAINGLPCHDSIFLVVSQLARWFYFIEFWDVDKSERIDSVVSLLTDYCLKKSNGYISRLEMGLKADVVGHVRRIVEKAIAETDSQGKLFFSIVRQKRNHHAYRRIIYLEQAVSCAASAVSGQEHAHDAAHLPEEDDRASSLPVGFTLCCSVSPTTQTPKEKREAADNWEYEADDAPLPAELEKQIRDYYCDHGLNFYKPTIRKLSRLINHLWKSGGEARVGIQLLKKMGFADHAARQHVKRLEDMGIITASGYCPAAAISKGFKLSKRTMAMFKDRLPKEKTA